MKRLLWAMSNAAKYTFVITIAIITLIVFVMAIMTILFKIGVDILLAAIITLLLMVFTLISVDLYFDKRIK